jgi:hypothetical protein
MDLVIRVTPDWWSCAPAESANCPGWFLLSGVTAGPVVLGSCDQVNEPSVE